MHARSISFGAVAPRVSIGERYRALHNRRALTWWSTVFGYPIARFALIWIVPVRWITPTQVTLVGFVAKLAAAAASRIDGGAPVIGWRAIRREWLRGWLKMPLFLEADLYVWIGVFAWFGAWRALCVVLAATQGAALVVVVAHHLHSLSRRPS